MLVLCTTPLSQIFIEKYTFPQDGPRDILRPLRFKMSYEINQEEPVPVQEGDPLPDIDEYPILNQQEAVRYEYR